MERWYWNTGEGQITGLGQGSEKLGNASLGRSLSELNVVGDEVPEAWDIMVYATFVENLSETKSSRELLKCNGAERNET